MRLYQLIERVGYVKSGLFPWFSPPAAGAPVRYYGWAWDPETREWVATDLEPIQITIPQEIGPMPSSPPGPARPNRVLGWEWSPSTGKWWEMPMPMVEKLGRKERPPMPEYPYGHPELGETKGWAFDFVTRGWTPIEMPLEMIEVEQERPPAPEYTPGPEIPVRVPGWQWNRDEQEWIRVVAAEEFVEFEPPSTLPPYVDVAGLHVVYPLEQQYELFVQSLIARGLAPHEAKRVAEAIGESVLKTIWARKTEMNRDMWTDVSTQLRAQTGDLLEKIGVAAVLIIIAAAIGFVIGDILERLTIPRRERISLKPPEPTFLLGPDKWLYGKHVGRSVKGENYYSACYEIGTTYVRHKRGYGVGVIDVIDFPGGFVEEGWAWGKYRKYTWELWTIKYVGFLIRINDGLFRLKRAPLDPDAPPFIVFQMPEAQWCTDFLYYL